MLKHKLNQISETKIKFQDLYIGTNNDKLHEFLYKKFKVITSFCSILTFSTNNFIQVCNLDIKKSICYVILDKCHYKKYMGRMSPLFNNRTDCKSSLALVFSLSIHLLLSFKYLYFLIVLYIYRSYYNNNYKSRKLQRKMLIDLFTFKIYITFNKSLIYFILIFKNLKSINTYGSKCSCCILLLQ